MTKHLTGLMARTEMVALSWLGWQLCQSSTLANPAGGTVAHGAATFNPAGSQLTINVSSPTATINWQSFNIGAGETTTFVQPSSSSVVWNQINGGSPSQILGNLNANGYVILQNQSGFYIGGQATIATHGLLMTTAATPPPDLTSGGAWSFNTPPPTAKIINYGQINIGGGGSVFLIAGDIENNGTIAAPAGKIGLYDGEQVLVSYSPDGRGLSAQVTLPQGSVDNEGHLIADGGSIAAQAQTVNQNGLVQANSVQNINGVIELVAGDSLTLGANSDIEVHGDNSAANTTTSPGGFVVLQGDNTFNDTPGSLINVAGSTGAGGVDGVVEVFGNNLTDATSIQSTMDGVSAAQFGSQDFLLINPFDITISYNPTTTASSPPTSSSASVPANLNISDLANYAQIDIHALDNIELQNQWYPTDPGAPATLNLSAGNNLIFDDGSGINAGNNWSISLAAGTGFFPTSAQLTPASGSDGIYLNGSAYIQTENGDINAWAVNELQIDTTSSDLAGYSGIRTINGGNITVDTQYGDVNAGANPDGYVYAAKAPYYTVATAYSAAVGGISTAAGGNVTINAAGNVFSYLPADSTSVSAQDGGSGAFGPEPGNVTITAGESVYGHYVVANGAGSVTAGQDVGSANGNPFALSLVAGNWTVNAPNGNIYLQEVRNPNGTFNSLAGTKRSPNAGQFLFDYAADASVDLNAGDGVYLTGSGIPRLDSENVPVLYPPILDITAGSGGVTLEGNVTLFPSSDQNLTITTTAGGNLTAPASLNSPVELLMSDSASKSWQNSTTFSDADNTTGTPEELNNPNPVLINVSGSMENLNLITSKATQITVGGDMINCGFSGQNLHSSDITSLTVGGQIFNQSAYAFITLANAIPGIPAADLPPGLGISWDNIFTLALDPAIATVQIPSTVAPSQLENYALQQASLFGYSVQSGKYIGNNPGFLYNAATTQLGYAGPMAQNVLSALSQPTLTALRFGANGLPETYTGKDGNTYFVTDQIAWVAPATVNALFTASQSSASYENAQLGYRLGGPGQFDVSAGSISLGNSYGILSCGVEDPQGGFNRYANLAPETPVGATLNVTVDGDLSILTSTIATLGGGDVNVTSTGGSMDLGTAALFNSAFSPFRQVGLGLYSAGPGDVNVTSFGDVNIDGSRIAAFDGGNISVESLQGNVNVGSGVSTPNGVYVSFVDPATGVASSYAEDAYGSGIVANTLQDPSQVPGSPLAPGNITVQTPRGDITASLGGITQVALNGNIAGGPTIDLVAGTFPAGTPGTPDYIPGYTGNIDLGDSGVIGGTIILKANGNIKAGLILSRQGTTFSAAKSFTGNVVSGEGISGTAGQSIVGTLAGVGGVSVSGLAVTATVLSQSASVNGASAKSTLGSSANATSASQSAANQSNAQAQQQLANNDTTPNDDSKKKKPLIQRVKRVTVILPAKT